MPPTTWTEDAVVALLMNVMRQTNPTLQGSNWKGIAETMEPVLGTNQNVLQKKYNQIRTQFMAANPQEQTNAAVATPPSKRKRGKKGDVSATPSKKSRGKAPAKSTAMVEDEDNEDKDEKDEGDN